MKEFNRQVILLLLGVMIISLFSISFSETYSDETYDFTFKVPQNWIVDKNPAAPDVHVAFYPENNIMTNISIAVVDIGTSEDFRDYTDQDFETYLEGYEIEMTNETIINQWAYYIMV